jgi:ABC-type sugar transport system ATPase subunit
LAAPSDEGTASREDETVTGSPAHMSVPLVEMRLISRAFGGVAALQNVDLAVYRNEVVALLGDNGAGKSTLIKILAGALAPDTGEILFEGRQVSITGPRNAKDLGIETIYQDLALCDNLDVPTNVFLGRELMRPILGRLLSIFDRRRMAGATRELLTRLRIELGSLQTQVRILSGGQRQSIAIAKSVYFNAKLIIMDEPTAALGMRQTEKVLGLVRELKQAGLAIIYISHILEDVFRVADRLIVLKNGRKIGERLTSETNRDEVVRMMITGVDAAEAA